MIVAVRNVNCSTEYVRIDTLHPLYHYPNISSSSSSCDENKKAAAPEGLLSLRTNNVTEVGLQRNYFYCSFPYPSTGAIVWVFPKMSGISYEVLPVR